MPLNSLTILLDRSRKIYHQGETITGRVLVDNKYELRHEGIFVSLVGLIDVHFNLRKISFLDTFYGSNKTINILDKTIELAKPGILRPGTSEYLFQLSIDSFDRNVLYETYHGVFIGIQYYVRCQLKRSFLSKDLLDSVEFFIEYDSNPIGAPTTYKQPLTFQITPDNLTVSKATTDAVPDFLITGKLDSLVCKLIEPITGEFVIKKCDAIIRSVELQLVRIETCGITPGDRDYSRDATEIQNIQIGDGNLLRNISIQIYIILPKLFTCPTLITSNFKIEFELNLVLIFDDNHLITENFPLKLIRSTLQP